MAGESENVENREWEAEQGGIQPSSGHLGVVLTVLSTKISRRKIGVSHRPTRNWVEYTFSLHLFPFSSDSDFRFPRMTAELARGGFQVCAGGREAGFPVPSRNACTAHALFSVTWLNLKV